MNHLLQDFGKILIILGIVLAFAGLLLTGLGKISFLGRLPGDIFIQRKNFTFYFPITTSILISILISLILYFISKK
ncbi:MAG: DUF2905 domain-containing protein [Calditrichaeota bacterium]|nr:DUF2905 domain-containing protein [Calditrichota bacterium]